MMTKAYRLRATTFATGGSSARAVIPIKMAQGIFLLEQVYVVPDVVGAGGTTYSTWLGAYTSTGDEPEKYDPSVRFLDEDRAVTAGTPSAPGRDPAEWVAKGVGVGDVYMPIRRSTLADGTGNIVLVVEFNAGTNHTGRVEIGGTWSPIERQAI
jgi:hypothetical protein